MMSKLILFNKPYGVLSQFTGEVDESTLADFLFIPDIYPAGRLDKDSEGLLLLTADGNLQQKISNPRFKLAKTYWVQVEHVPTQRDLDKLRKGVVLKDGPCKPAEVEIIAEPDLWLRYPPIRYRAKIPTCWLAITIREGRNRQVRRMTAAIGFPTLRLVRVQIGKWQLNDLLPGQWREVEGIL